jgi:hypothetical protein
VELPAEKVHRLDGRKVVLRLALLVSGPSFEVAVKHSLLMTRLNVYTTR